MSSITEMATELSGRVGKPAYVEFSQVAKHLPFRSEQEGRYIAIDVDMVTVRQIGSADSSIFEVTRWLKQNQDEVKGGRLPREHADYYARAYQLWKNGQELPLEGTPIKGWAVIAPSQAEAIVRAGIRTVEDLATMNGEAMQKIGMGAVMLKNKAQAWVAQAQDKGPLTIEMANLKAKNELLELNLQKLTEEFMALKPEKSGRAAKARQVEEPIQDGIGLTDILDEQPRRGPGRPRKEA